MDGEKTYGPCPMDGDHETDDPYGGPCTDCWGALDLLHDMSEDHYGHR